MGTDSVTAPEITSLARAGGLVRTQETKAMFEVSVPVPLYLPEIRVPVATGSHPAESRHLPAEVCDRPTITVPTIAAAISVNAAPIVVIFEGLAPTSRLQKRHLSNVLNRHHEGVLTRRSLEPIEGDGIQVFPMAFKNTGRWRNVG